MPKRIFIFILLLLSVMSSAPVFASEIPDHPLIEQAKQTRMPRINYAIRNGAEIHLTKDGKSFYILWFPEGTDPKNPPPVIATIHGHGSWAFEEFYHWHPYAKERGYGILAVQWWLGKGERFQDYLTPQEIYSVLEDVFKEKSVKPGSVLFHGFSRGSANSYAVAAVDHSSGNNYFGLIVANSGKPSLDFPPNIEIEKGKFGAEPLKGTHWVTFAGAKDTHPDRDGIEGMREAAQWIQKYGGTVDLAIEDPDQDHGGFHKNPKNVNAALDIFKKILSFAHSS